MNSIKTKGFVYTLPLILLFAFSDASWAKGKNKVDKDCDSYSNCTAPMQKKGTTLEKTNKQCSYAASPDTKYFIYNVKNNKNYTACVKTN